MTEQQKANTLAKYVDVSTRNQELSKKVAKKLRAKGMTERADEIDEGVERMRKGLQRTLINSVFSRMKS